MTWLGKILAVCAMVLALGWMWLTASVYATRTNWQARSDQYAAAYKDARTTLEADQRGFQAKQNALAKQLAASEAKAAGLAAQVATLEKANKDYTGQIAGLNNTIKDSDVKATELQAALGSLLTQTDQVRKRAGDLEEKVVQLTIVKEGAEKDKLSAEIAKKQAEAERDSANARAEDLRGQLAEARDPNSRGGSGLLRQAVAPVPEGLRGTVEAVSGGNLELNVGFEAGLTVGAVVDVSRIGKTAADSKYLGTATIDRVDAKRAVATFRPASGRPLAQLPAADRPQAKDTVTKAAGRP